MPICTVCGTRFEIPFGDSAETPTTCPACTPAAARDVFVQVASQGTPMVTWVLIALNVLVFVVMVARGVSFIDPDAQRVLAFGADYGPLTLQGQWWRMFTSTFVHFGIIHLAFNMWCLWSLGRMAERLMGRAGFLIAYLASGLAGSVASLLWDPMRISAGASGAIFGIAGALVAFVFFKKASLETQAAKKLVKSVGVFLLYNLVYGAARAGIDVSAHLGGLVMGLAIGSLLPRALAEDLGPIANEAKVAPGPAPSEPDRQRRLATLAICSALVVILGAGAAKRVHGSTVFLGEAEQLIAAKQFPRAIEVLKTVVARDPKFAQGQFRLGEMYIRTDQSALAIAPLERAVALEPDNINYQHDLAAAYLGTKDYDRAIELFEKVVKAEQASFTAHYALGYAYLQKGRYTEAVSELASAAALSPEDPDIQNALGRGYLGLDNPSEARAVFQRILNKYPDDADAKTGLAAANSWNGSASRGDPNAKH